MKKFLRLIYITLMKCVRNFKWKVQAAVMHVSLDNATNIEKELMIDENDEILILVPHADDELIGCYSIIKKYHKNVVLWYSGMTGDDTSEKNKEIRKNEFLNFCDMMGVKAIICEDKAEKNLKKALDECDPKYMFVPSVVDWHREHRKLFCLAKNAVSGSNIELFCYQITVPIPEGYITNYSIVEKKECTEKWNLLEKVYISQSFMPIQRMKAVERVYRKLGKNIIAEVFMKLDENLYNCVDIEEQCKEFNFLKRKIDNLVKIRREADLEYKKIFNVVGKDEYCG